jgi:hypothetical protein
MCEKRTRNFLLSASIKALAALRVGVTSVMHSSTNESPKDNFILTHSRGEEAIRCGRVVPRRYFKT